MKSNYSSLLITPELCENRGANKKHVDFLKEYYPNGITIRDIIEKRVKRIPVDLICWGYHFLPYTAEDKNDFFDYVKIEDSTRWYQSHHIRNCDKINNSSYCYDSRKISYCHNVNSSFDIENSSDIWNSTLVVNSMEIDASSYCINAMRVSNSHHVKNSNNIKESFAITDSENVVNSLYLFGVKNVENSILSFGDNFKNRIFCSKDCPEVSYAIFDEEVGEAKFKFYFGRLEEILKSESFFEVDSELKSQKPTVIITKNRMRDFSTEILSLFPQITEKQKDMLYNFTFCENFKF